jgi:hypothetical protein
MHMTKILRFLGVFLTLGVLAFLSLSSRLSTTLISSTATPGSKTKAVLSLESQAGHSDGLLALGIMIFVFIAIPIFMRYRDMRLPEKSTTINQK